MRSFKLLDTGLKEFCCICYTEGLMNVFGNSANLSFSTYCRFGTKSIREV